MEASVETRPGRANNASFRGSTTKAATAARAQQRPKISRPPSIAMLAPPPPLPFAPLQWQVSQPSIQASQSASAVPLFLSCLSRSSVSICAHVKPMTRVSAGHSSEAKPRDREGCPPLYYTPKPTNYKTDSDTLALIKIVWPRQDKHGIDRPSFILSSTSRLRCNKLAGHREQRITDTGPRERKRMRREKKEKRSIRGHAILCPSSTP